MATLDVSDAFDPEFFDKITVNRRAETVGNNGRSTVAVTPFLNVRAIVGPQGDNDLRRGDAEQHAGKTIQVITKFRLQGEVESPPQGYQPDIVVWHGDNFLVRRVEDWAGWGKGFIVAECTSMDLVDLPPPA